MLTTILHGEAAITVQQNKVSKIVMMLNNVILKHYI